MQNRIDSNGCRTTDTGKMKKYEKMEKKEKRKNLNKKEEWKYSEKNENGGRNAEVLIDLAIP